MERRRSIPSLLAAVAAWGALLGVTAGVEGQSGLHFQVSPSVGVGNFPGETRFVPYPDLGVVSVRMDARWIAGLSAEASFGTLPVRVRLGVLRTFGGFLKRASVRDPTPVGSATVTMIGGDLVAAPFVWPVSPYGFVGVSRRITSYAPTDPNLDPYYTSGESESPGRYGIGLDLRALPVGSLWLEGSLNSSGNSLLVMGIRLRI